MVRIGLTGGIGCGKSYVARLLEKRGIPVYDSDSEAKRLSDSSVDIRNRLVALTGMENLYADGMLNRKLLAEYLFESKENARAVENIIHPVVKSDFINWAANQTASISAIESAILFESGFTDVVDYIVLGLIVEELVLRDDLDHRESDILLTMLKSPEEDFLAFVRAVAGNDTIEYNDEVALSEREKGYLNAS